MSTKTQTTLLKSILLLCSSCFLAQTRTAEQEALRYEHEKHLAPETITSTERVLLRLKTDRLIERVNYGFNGLRAKLGGLVTGGGFALGPEYFREGSAVHTVPCRNSPESSEMNRRLFSYLSRLMPDYHERGMSS